MGYVLDSSRTFGEGGYCGQGHHGVGERVHVDFDAPQSGRALYLDIVRGYLDTTAHVAQHPSEAQVALRRARAETGDGDAPSRYGRRRHKVGCPRGVRLHLIVPRGILGGFDREAAIAAIYVDLERPHQGDRDADVGPFFPAFGEQRDRGLCVGRCHQKAADELAALAPRDACLPAGDAAALYGQGEPSVFPGVLHHGTQLPHRIYEIGDRPLAHSGNPIYGVRPPAQGERWRQETGHRARVADEEVYPRGPDKATLAAYVNLCQATVGADVDTESYEGVHKPV